MSKIALFLLLFLSACAYCPNSVVYRELYDHLNISYAHCEPMQETPYFLVILVEARHLDYSCPRSFFKTLAKHPSDGSKNGDVGHAWIYIQGESACLEGGHSGELGRTQPRYVEGVFLNYEQEDENPISYLWECQRDGFFQWGGGKHSPTFAIKVDLTVDQFHRILKFIESYDYSEYAITGNQCCTFATQIAAFAGLDLDCEITLPVDQCLKVNAQEIILWKDPVYAEITFSTPDILERSMMKAVAEESAEYALSWYRQCHRSAKQYSLQDLIKFPERYIRFKTL